LYYFTADLHLGHKNIIKLCNRPFKTIEEHDKLIESNLVTLTSEDTLFILGDLGCKDNIYKLRGFLQKIKADVKVILGNHDNLQMLVTLKREGLISEIKESKLIQLGKDRIFLSHYPYREWPQFYKGAYHLYGHCHNRIQDFKKSTDVGVDKWKFAPVSWERLEKYFV
jgi:calcineurin-like phosphoesterase family protein